MFGLLINPTQQHLINQHQMVSIIFNQFFSRRQSLVHPASLCTVLKLSQPRLSVLRLGEDDAVVKSVSLTLPELDEVRLNDVATPVRKTSHRKLRSLNLHLSPTGLYLPLSDPKRTKCVMLQRQMWQWDSFSHLSFCKKSYPARKLYQKHHFKILHFN